MRVLALVDLDGFLFDPELLPAALDSAEFPSLGEASSVVEVVVVVGGNVVTMECGRDAWERAAELVAAAVARWTAGAEFKVVTEPVFSWVGPESTDRALWLAVSMASTSATAGPFDAALTVTKDHGLSRELYVRFGLSGSVAGAWEHRAQACDTKVYLRWLIGAFGRERCCSPPSSPSEVAKGPVTVVGVDAPAAAPLVPVHSGRFDDILRTVHERPWSMSQVTFLHEHARNASRVVRGATVLGIAPAPGTELGPDPVGLAPHRVVDAEWRVAASRQGAVIGESDHVRWVFISSWPPALLNAVGAEEPHGKLGDRSAPVELAARPLPTGATLFEFTTGEHWWLLWWRRKLRGFAKWRVPYLGLGAPAALRGRLEVNAANEVVTVAVDQSGADVCGTVVHGTLTRARLHLVTLTDATHAILLATRTGPAGSMAVRPIQSFGVDELTGWLGVGEEVARDLLAAPLVVPVPYPG